jgi:hypothetical protein
MFSIDVDHVFGLIRCRGGGFQSPTEVRAHHMALKEAVDRCRLKHGCAKIIVLCEDPIPQSAETIQAVKDTWQKLEPGDQMALVVDRALPKLQAARSFLSEATKAFASEEQAMEWLGFLSSCKPN